MGLSRQSHWWR